MPGTAELIPGEIMKSNNHSIIVIDNNRSLQYNWCMFYIFSISQYTLKFFGNIFFLSVSIEI